MSRTQQRLDGIVSGKSITEIESEFGHSDGIPNVMIHYYFLLAKDHPQATTLIQKMHPEYSKIIEYRLSLLSEVEKYNHETFVQIEKQVSEQFQFQFVQSPELLYNAYSYIILTKPKRGRPKITEEQRLAQKKKHKEKVKANMEFMYKVNKLTTDIKFTQDELRQLGTCSQSVSEKLQNLLKSFTIVKDS